MKLFFTVLMSAACVLFSVHSAVYGEEHYSIRNIPSHLLVNADAVIRKDIIQFDVRDENTAYEKVYFAVTIFNKEGRDRGSLNIWYNSFRSIKSLEGHVYDSEGNEVRELEESDVADISYFSDYSFYEDTRLRHAEMFYDKYPYTVEFTYELKLKGYLNWPGWFSRTSIDPVVISAFEVLLPKEQALRFWANHDSLMKPSIVTNGNQKVYSWKARNLPLLSKDTYGDDIEDLAAVVKIAPAEFEIGGFSGSMNSWKDFGLWMACLYKGKQELSGRIKEEIHRQYSESDNIHEKITKLYKYMQSRTRYVNIQLGIGGWQPFDANLVHEKGYGDCKALSNYMVSILQEAGIKAYTALINSGPHRLPIIKEFPSNQFNHAICCVPLEKDTIWLECTSSLMAAAQIGRSNENRSALLITENGGILIPTPKSNSSDNLQMRKAHVLIKSFGDAAANTTVAWKGSQQENVIHEIGHAAPEERQKWVANTMGVPDQRLHHFSFNGIENKKCEIVLSFQADIPNLATVSGKRLFFKPNIMERRTYIPKDVEKRMSQVRFSTPYLDIDTVYFSIPKGYKVEALPKEAKFSTPYASYISNITVADETSLIYTRSLEIKDYSIPAENYAEYRKFISDVVKADRAQAVFVKE